jgi:predicted hotdog family 3-hydroxylacyl-ACP dehydratase
VKVIIGTRRYHSTACPLIRGAGDTGVETMTISQAESAGLTSCSVCQNDRESVG